MEKHCVNCDKYYVCNDVETYGMGFDNAEVCDYYEEDDNTFCGADMRKPNCVTCDHFGDCEGCEKGDEE